jgi:hypothetical protein
VCDHNNSASASFQFTHPHTTQLILKLQATMDSFFSSETADSTHTLSPFSYPHLPLTQSTPARLPLYKMHTNHIKISDTQTQQIMSALFTHIESQSSRLDSMAADLTQLNPRYDMSFPDHSPSFDVDLQAMLADLPRLKLNRRNKNVLRVIVRQYKALAGRYLELR